MNGRNGSSVDARIRDCRTSDATVTLIHSGAPLAGRQVRVAQRSHAFSFGCIGFEMLALANDETKGQAREKLEALAAEFLELFTVTTLPFYWAGFEPTRGKPDTDRLAATARWFADRGVSPKGHPLAWHTGAPDWLLGLSNAEIEAALKSRIRRDVAAFTGLIDTWDAVNEAVIMPVFRQYDNGLTRICRANGRIATIRLAFETAREANPDAFLLLNDFDMSTAYECLIEGVLEAGIKVDALGLQSHMHQGYWGEEKTLDVLDRFSRYGLRLHFTENTILSGRLMPPEFDDLNDYRAETWPTTRPGEARQADEVVRHYKTLLSHPAVDSITWWGLPDGEWLNAPGGLVRADYSPKPSYEALKALVKGEWWLAPMETTTDGQGKIHLSGWLGEYEVSVDGGKPVTFRLDSTGETALDVRLEG